MRWQRHTHERQWIGEADRLAKQLALHWQGETRIPSVSQSPSKGIELTALFNRRLRNRRFGFRFYFSYRTITVTTSSRACNYQHTTLTLNAGLEKT